MALGAAQSIQLKPMICKQSYKYTVHETETVCSCGAVIRTQLMLFINRIIPSITVKGSAHCSKTFSNHENDKPKNMDKHKPLK